MSLTRARVALGRSGEGLPTAAMLDFQRDHALARDAVHAVFEPERLAADLAPRSTLTVSSRARDRGEYLKRPDLGRRLDPASLAILPKGEWDLAIVVGDGLSAPAAHAHAAPVLQALSERLNNWRIAPIVLARFARVALADEIGEALGAGMVLMLLGERPGLSAADSLGAYLTWAPVVGRLDSERNCVSNIRPPDGLSAETAADTLAWLMTQARTRRLTGVALKDERDDMGRLPSGPSAPTIEV